MIKHNVVARFNDGSVLKGVTSDFTPLKLLFHIETDNGTVETIDMEKLKAVFFTRDYKRNNAPSNRYKNIRDLDGKKVQVHFIDGEVIIGYALEYISDYFGFFVTPADSPSNNERVFVMTSATQKITFI